MCIRDSSRLTFANLAQGGKNTVQFQTAETLWIPLDYGIHENAIIGEIYEDSKDGVQIESLTSPLPMDGGLAIQNRLFSGTNNTLGIARRYRIKYTCTFTLKYFPFDRQNCTFTMKMKSDKYTTVSLVEGDRAVYYDGPEMVKQFQIEKITSSTALDSNQTTFNFTIIMQRLFTDQLITTFFPTCLLWLLAYFTLFITVDDFNDRIMVAVTALLVLAALLSSINGSLPDTSYFKYIDLWFLWYTTNIFLITAFHIVLDQIDSSSGSSSMVISSSAARVDQGKAIIIEKDNGCKKTKINKSAAKIFPAMTIIFNVVYFGLQFFHYVRD